MNHPSVAHVVSLDLPKTMEDYVHRIRRIGCAGTLSHATSFFTYKNLLLVAQIMQVIIDVELGNTMVFAIGKVEEERKKSK